MGYELVRELYRMGYELVSELYGLGYELVSELYGLSYEHNVWPFLVTCYAATQTLTATYMHTRVHRQPLATMPTTMR